MSHYTVAVITKTPSEDEVTELLAPYQEGDAFFETIDEGADCPAKWDWYVLGGRWLGMLRVKDPAEQVATGQPGTFDNTADENTCDMARIGNIDFDAIVKEATKAARDRWENTEGDRTDPKNYDLYGFMNVPSPLPTTADEYVAWDVKDPDVLTYAVLTPDGEWHEPGQMGWWGMSDEDDVTKQSYNVKFRQLMQDYQDHYLWVMDCHI